MKKATNNYWKGLGWFVLSRVVSCSNNVLAKYLTNLEAGTSLHFSEIVFIRFCIGTVLLGLYAMLTLKPLTTNVPNRIHLLRGTMLASAFGLWNYGLPNVSIVMGTIVSFTEPVFVVVFSILVLKEKARLSAIWVTLFGLIGVFIGNYNNDEGFSWNIPLLVLLSSSMLFVGLDILNKRYGKGNVLGMIFYPSGISALCLLPFAWTYWIPPTLTQMGLLVFLGLGSNAILYCLIKAYRYTSLLSLAPIRYIEFPFAIITGLVFFHQKPDLYELLSAGIVIPAMLWILYHERGVANR